MHPFPRQNVDATGHRRRRRRDKDRIGAIVQYLDDQRWDESVLDLDQRRLKGLFLAAPRQPLGEATEKE
jgi:hypothetical protein